MRAGGACRRFHQSDFTSQFRGKKKKNTHRAAAIRCARAKPSRCSRRAARVHEVKELRVPVGPTRTFPSRDRTRAHHGMMDCPIKVRFWPGPARLGPAAAEREARVFPSPLKFLFLPVRGRMSVLVQPTAAPRAQAEPPRAPCRPRPPGSAARGAVRFGPSGSTRNTKTAG